jgi:cell wall-associated NlpC family hydrolase
VWQIAAHFADFPGCQCPAGLLASPTCDGGGLLHARRCDHDPENVIRFLTRQAPVLVLAIAAACTVAAGAKGDPISSKQAQARAVMAQLQRLDANAQRASSAYQVATLRLHSLDQSLRVNRQALGVDKANLKQAQKALAQRLVTIYTNGDEQSTLAVILGAHSLNQLVNRVETIQTVSTEDRAMIGQIVGFHRQIVQRRAFLRHAHTLQVKLVATRRASKQRIAQEVAREQKLYASVKSELDQLVAQQRARQLAAAKLAEARASAAQASEPQSGFGVSASLGSAAVAPPSQYTGVVAIAMRYLGVQYVWGGSSPSGFDCSGFVMYVYAQVGVSLPHYTVAQWNMGVPVSRGDLEPGDLVFFDGLGHVGIYVGGGQFIHAPHTGTVVQISSLDSGWYAAEYDGARRITG